MGRRKKLTTQFEIGTFKKRFGISVMNSLGIWWRGLRLESLNGVLTSQTEIYICCINQLKFCKGLGKVRYLKDGT